MKKIIVAFATVSLTLAACGVAEARLHQHNNRYSATSDVEMYDPLAGILGTEDQPVSPQPRFKSKRQADSYYQEREDKWGLPVASTSLVELGHDLQRRGYRVSEHPHFGGVHHVHANHSMHYAGRAIDVNVGRGVVEARSGYAHRFDQLAAELRSEGYTVLWRVPGHYDHMHIQH